MGSCFFLCRSRRRRWSSSSPCFEGVRLVHLSGYVEEFKEAITVRQVMGKPPSKHFVCSSSQLLSFGSKPLGLDAELLPGHFYFLLPHSVLQSDSSPLDLVSLSTRLTAIAMRGPQSPKPKTTTTTTTGKGGDEYHRRLVMSPSVQSWKPVLETIEEKSFDRRSETT